MTLAQAYEEARSRAWMYDDCTAGRAWAAMAVRRRSRILLPWCYYEAMDDAQASDDPSLIEAVRLIAGHHQKIARRHYGDRGETKARGIAEAIQ